MREFILNSENYFGKNTIALYIDALEDEDIEKALTYNRSIRPILNNNIVVRESWGTYR